MQIRFKDLCIEIKEIKNKKPIALVQSSDCDFSVPLEGVGTAISISVGKWDIHHSIANGLSEWHTHFGIPKKEELQETPEPEINRKINGKKVQSYAQAFAAKCNLSD